MNHPPPRRPLAPVLALALGCLAAMPGLATAQGAPSAGSAIDTGVQLPGIRAYIKRSDEAAKPSITLEELSQCVGSDAQLRERIAGLLNRRQALMQARQGLEAMQRDVQASNVDIATRRAALDQLASPAPGESVKAQQARHQAFNAQRQAFTQAVNAHNARVAVLNSQGAQWDVQRQALATDTAQMQADTAQLEKACGGPRALVKPAAASEPTPP